MSPTEHLRPRRSRRRKEADTIHGVLLVDKPHEWTSHDVVNCIRRRFDLNKTGHGGTLDPNATGLLPILVGRGTKISDRVMASDKEYEGTMTLGIRTDSQDSDGEVIREASWEGVSLESIQAAFTERVGDQYQTPPMVSAVKKDGVPLYKLARKGQSIEREARFIHVYNFDLLNFDAPRVDFRIRCTKGTYVRTLCDDIGEALGCGAHLSALRRTETGGCRIEDAFTMDEIKTWEREQLAEHLVPLRHFAAPAGPIPSA